MGLTGGVDITRGLKIGPPLLAYREIRDRTYNRSSLMRSRLSLRRDESGMSVSQSGMCDAEEDEKRELFLYGSKEVAESQ